MSKQKSNSSWRNQLHEIIYEADTPAGKFFDLSLLVVILLSLALVMLESIEPIGTKYTLIFNILEWIITVLFSLEYIARIVCVKKPKAYIFSFYGIVDFLSTVPKYISRTIRSLSDKVSNAPFTSSLMDSIMIFASGSSASASSIISNRLLFSPS